MKLNVSFSPFKARNYAPDMFVFKAISRGTGRPLPELSDRIEYLIVVIAFYLIFSLIINGIGNMYGMFKGEDKKVAGKIIENKE